MQQNRGSTNSRSGVFRCFFIGPVAQVDRATAFSILTEFTKRSAGKFIVRMRIPPRDARAGLSVHWKLNFGPVAQVDRATAF